MSYSTIIVKEENRIGTIIFNRPEVLNALNGTMRQEIFTALDKMEKGKEIDVVILTGSGRSFCPGVDTKDIQVNDLSKETQGSQEAVRWDIWDKVRNLDRPVIAAVHGHVLTGGLELALACDLIIASEDAVFGDTHARLGVVPGAGNTQILPRLVGMAKAKEMLFTANRVSAQEALNIGLINKVVPRDQLESAAQQMAGAILGCQQPAVRRIKYMINHETEGGLQFEKAEAEKWNVFAFWKKDK